MFENRIKNVGKALSILRKKRKMSQAQLAQIVGLDQAAISRIENGKQKLYVDQLGQMCAALKINPRKMLYPERVIGGERDR